MAKQKAGYKRGTYLRMFRGPSKRDYKERIIWFLDFLNTDISTVPSVRFKSLFFKCLEFFYGPVVEDKRMLKSLCRDTETDRHQLGIVQDVARRDLNYVRCFFVDNKGTSIDAEAKIDLKYRLLQDGRISLMPPAEIIYKHDAQYDDENYLLSQQWENLYGRNMSLSPGKFSEFRDQKLHATIWFFLMDLLEKFPLSTIRQCPGCKNLFKATSRKKSELCDRCLKKETTYRWRDKNREVYNTYQRDRKKGLKRTPREIKAELERSGNSS